LEYNGVVFRWLTLATFDKHTSRDVNQTGNVIGCWSQFSLLYVVLYIDIEMAL